jgi:hypothetical protein
MLEHVHMALKFLVSDRSLQVPNLHYVSYESISWSILRVPLFPAHEAVKFVVLSKSAIGLPSVGISMPNDQCLAWRTDNDDNVTATNFPKLPNQPPNTTLYYHWCELKATAIVPALLIEGVLPPQETNSQTYTYAEVSQKDFGNGLYVSNDLELVITLINSYFKCNF